MQKILNSSNDNSTTENFQNVASLAVKRRHHKDFTLSKVCGPNEMTADNLNAIDIKGKDNIDGEKVYVYAIRQKTNGVWSTTLAELNYEDIRQAFPVDRKSAGVPPQADFALIVADDDAEPDGLHPHGRDDGRSRAAIFIRRTDALARNLIDRLRLDARLETVPFSTEELLKGSGWAMKARPDGCIYDFIEPLSPAHG